MQKEYLKTLFLCAGASLCSVNVNADIRAGNVVIDANGIQVGGGIKVSPDGVQVNGVSVNANGVQVPGVKIPHLKNQDAEEEDDDEDTRTKHQEPGYGAGEGAGSGAGQHSGKHSKSNINADRGSIVIDGETVRNQTIINRSKN